MPPRVHVFVCDNRRPEGGRPACGARGDDVALALARQRLMGAKFPYYLLADSSEGRLKEGQLTAKPLPASASTNRAASWRHW